MRGVIEDLDRRRAKRAAGGGERRVAAQHAKGKLTARERIELLLDPGSFEEYDTFVEHRSTDFGMERRGSRATASSPAGARSTAAPSWSSPRISPCSAARCPRPTPPRSSRCRISRMKIRAPIIGIFDAGGARIQEGVAALGGYGEVFRRNAEASGVIPQISVIMGPCAGGDVYSPAMTDFIVMVRDTSYMFVTGPDVVKTVTNESRHGRGPRRRPRPHHPLLHRRHGFRRRRRGAAAGAAPRRLPAREQHGRAARMAELRRCRAPRRLARHAGARERQHALRHQGTDREGRRRGRLLRDPGAPSPATS